MGKVKKGLIYIFLILGILGILDTITLLIFTNIDMGIILPGLMGIILIAYVYLKILVYKSEPIIKNRKIRVGVIVIIGILFSAFIIGEGLILFNSHSEENVKMEYLIILGAGVRGETVSDTLKERLDKGIEYLNQYQNTKVIVSGGKGNNEKISEAEAMQIYLIEKGINPVRIIKEGKSTSTMENFKYSKILLADMDKKDITDVMVITSDYHMLRAKMLAQRNGLKAYGITCRTPANVWVNSYIREYLAWIKSYLFDR